MSTLDNFVTLEPNKWKWLFVSNPRTVLKKGIKDPLDQTRKDIQSRRWTVTREDRAIVNKVFDVTSVKLDRQLMQLYNIGSLDSQEVGIRKSGSGFATEYEIDLRPIQS